MARKQRVKFHKGDQRPGKIEYELSYSYLPYKKGNDIVWRVIESPTLSQLIDYEFEEDAKKLVDFQNENKVWKENGGVPSFLCINSSKTNY